MSQIQLREGAEVVPLKQVRQLYMKVRWLHWMRPRLLKSALERSDFVVSAWDGKRLVGLARVISDGCFNAYIPDVLVHPEYHRRGIGRMLLRRVIERFPHVYNLTVVAEDEEGRSFFHAVGFSDERVALRIMRPIRSVVKVQLERWTDERT